MISRWHQLYYPIRNIKREDDKMDNSASRITHLFDRLFLHHSRHHLSSKTLWHLLHLPSIYKHELITMLHNQCSSKASQQQSTRSKQVPETSRESSAAGYTYLPTSKALKTPSNSSIYLFNACAPAFYIQEETQ